MSTFRPQTYQTLVERGARKCDLFEGVRETFDYALPQDWLDDFAAWCKYHRPFVTYDLILSTTVWVYPPGFIFGHPLTACTEVQAALDCYGKRK